MSCQIPTPPYDITLTLGSAPSWAFTLEDDATGTPVSLDIAGASIWFAIKTQPTDTDAAALVFASTIDGNIAITDAAAGEFQVDLSEGDTAPTTSLVAGATYYSYVKIQLASGETRVRSGWVTTLPEGIEAP